MNTTHADIVVTLLRYDATYGCFDSVLYSWQDVLDATDPETADEYVWDAAVQMVGAKAGVAMMQAADAEYVRSVVALVDDALAAQPVVP